MNNKKFRIELFEEEGGYWSFGVWDGKVCLCRSKIGIGDEHKSLVRKKAIEFAERQPDYGSHTINEHYQLV